MGRDWLSEELISSAAKAHQREAKNRNEVLNAPSRTWNSITARTHVHSNFRTSATEPFFKEGNGQASIPGSHCVFQSAMLALVLL